MAWQSGMLLCEIRYRRKLGRRGYPSTIYRDPNTYESEMMACGLSINLISKPPKE